jgi:hypothetical protein
MPVEPLVDTLISLVKDNMVARTDITSDAIIGSNVISVYNSFHFSADQEVVLIDNGYNQEGSSHYQIFEYAKIKWVNNTRSITLYDNLQGDWLVANNSFVQKTIGHSPLYDENVLFGDREIIPTDQMAVTVEPVSMSNEWMYLQGGLNEEYKLKVMVYGKDMKTDEGLRILVKYADNIVQLFNNNIHIGVDIYSTPLLSNVNIGDTVITIDNTPSNIDKFTVTNMVVPMLKDLKRIYQLQDNQGTNFWFGISNVNIAGSVIKLTMDTPSTLNFSLSEFAVIRKPKYYVWDSRADAATYGVTPKGSAILRAAEIGWYGKMINEFTFPQKALNIKKFKEIEEESSSSEGS